MLNRIFVATCLFAGAAFADNVMHPSTPILDRPTLMSPACGHVPPSRTATFIPKDTTTQGNWKSVNGTEGAIVLGDSASTPALVTVATAGSTTYNGRTEKIEILDSAANVLDSRTLTAFRAGQFQSDVERRRRRALLPLAHTFTPGRPRTTAPARVRPAPRLPGPDMLPLPQSPNENTP